MKFLGKSFMPYQILMIAALFCAFRGPAAKENKFLEHAANGKYVIDNKGSVVKWKCSMVFADKGGHDGYISPSKGELIIEKGQLIGGRVEIDMTSITDDSHRSDNNLIDHLKSPDFFDVQKFPSSTFAITHVAPANDDSVKVTGNLTIRNITHEVIFPAKLEVKGRAMTANGKLTIDRTQWDVRYRSGKFFADLADGAISDNIEFDIRLIALKD